MDIWLLVHCASTLCPNLLAEVEDGVHDCCGDRREREPVRDREGCGEEERRVGLVLADVECVLGREDALDVVRRARVVVARPRRYREELRVPRVRVVEHGDDEPEEEHEAERDVRRGPPRRRERGADVRDLRPVEGDEGHAEAAVVPEQLVDDDIVGRDPAYPVEDR